MDVVFLIRIDQSAEKFTKRHQSAKILEEKILRIRHNLAKNLPEALNLREVSLIIFTLLYLDELELSVGLITSGVSNSSLEM